MVVQARPQEVRVARRVANFLLAWHNAEENGGWDLVDLWNVDAANRRRHADGPAPRPRVPPLGGFDASKANFFRYFFPECLHLGAFL